MKARKIAAVGVLAVFLPLMADAVTEPYARRGAAESWCYGAIKLGAASALAWALNEIGAS